MADVMTDQRPLVLEDLAEYLAEGCKPASEFRIGAEHEKFGFRLHSYEPVPYEADGQGRGGIHAMLVGLRRFGWTDVLESGPRGDTLIDLERGGASVSLEPGGQFELSGAALPDIHAICAETGRHLEEVKAVADELGLGFIGLGFRDRKSVV